MQPENASQTHSEPHDSAEGEELIQAEAARAATAEVDADALPQDELEPLARNELLQALKDLGENLRAASIPFADRFDHLLERAFRLGGIQLNVKQLREFAGGGSQLTAQQSVARFRRKLMQVVLARAELDPQLPKALATALSAAGMEVWLQAQQLARSDFDVDRQRLEHDLAESARRESAAREQMESQVQRIATLMENGRREQARAEALAAELAGEKARGEQVRADLQERLDRAVALADSNRQEASRAMTEASEARAALLRQEKATAEALSEQGRGHMLEIDRMRQQSKATEALLRADLAKAVTRVDEMATQVNDQAVELATLRAHTTSEITSLRERLELAATTGAAAAGTARELERELAARDATIAELRSSNDALLRSLRSEVPTGTPGSSNVVASSKRKKG